MRQPTHRKIRGYVFDPSFSSTLKYRLTNEVIYQVKWEDNLKPGPVGEYVEVIDFDPTKQCFYESVDLNDPYILANQGLPLTDEDPKFHQQQVYAVTMCVIEKFEKALGRKMIFSRLSETREGNHTIYRNEFVRRLRIYPHAMYQQNAFYSPQKKALLFGYFRAQGEWRKNNIPNSAVFSCLSPDIVSHECTHAILDSMHPFLNQNTNPDMLAFHEGFADIIALLQRFTFKSVVQEQIRNSRGDLQSPENMLGSLAFQFARALPGSRSSLRSYLVDDDEKIVTADPNKYHNTIEPHERGAVLVLTVFDAFARLYKYRVADLIRIATGGSGILDGGDISPDLVNRLSDEACIIAEKLMLICIRALDFCPPADLVFSDFLRAMVTADVEHNPEDKDGLRFALIESFRNWGIVPESLVTYSLQSLMWQKLDEYYPGSEKLTSLQNSIKFIFNPDNQNKRNINHSIEKILRTDDREAIFKESRLLAAAVHGIFDSKFENYLFGMEGLLGMNFNKIIYNLIDPNTGDKIQLKSPGRDKFQVHRCRPIIRSKADSSETTKQLIITFLQKVEIDLANSPYSGYFKGDKFEFRGGSTLIVDLSNFEIKYAIVKSVSSIERLQKQLEYAMENQGDDGNSALLLEDNEPFAMIHSH